MKKERNSKPWDILNPNTEIVDKATFNKRIKICESCDKYIEPLSMCRVCGCFMEAKAKLSHSFCPIKKWESF